MNAIIYIHGKGGSAAESEHYKLLFPDCEVIGLDYQTFTPWDIGQEIRVAVEELKSKYENVILIANSIGAFFSMNAGIDEMIQKAFFISPIVDMEKLITDMMQWANVTEPELESKRKIHTDLGEDLSWEYLSYVRSHPIEWRVPTHILYGSNDHLTSIDSITDFAKKHNATLTIMENGEHWFHTEEQMQFLDHWITEHKEAAQIRSIENDKLNEALKLVKEVFLEFEAPDYCEEGIADFMHAIGDESYLSMHRFYGAYQDNKLVGVIATRNDHHHIGLLFVDKNYQRKGIGSQLIQHILDMKDEKPITVNSSPYGHEFYKKLGFADTSEEQITNGVRYYPMKRVAELS